MPADDGRSFFGWRSFGYRVNVLNGEMHIPFPGWLVGRQVDPAIEATASRLKPSADNVWLPAKSKNFWFKSYSLKTSNTIRKRERCN